MRRDCYKLAHYLCVLNVGKILYKKQLEVGCVLIIILISVDLASKINNYHVSYKWNTLTKSE